MNANRYYLFVSVLGGILVALSLWFVLSTLPSGAQAELLSPLASVRYVSTSGNDTNNNCTNSSTPCRTVQRALNVSQAGDEIRVAAGTYIGTMSQPSASVIATVILTKNISALLGGYSPNFATRNPVTHKTILSAAGIPGGQVVWISGTTTLVDGFTLTGAADGAIQIHGGSPAIRHNEIRSNSASPTRGVVDVSSSAVIEGNYVHDNQGDAIFTDSPRPITVTNNVVAQNSGAGVVGYNFRDVRIVNNTFVSNSIIMFAEPTTPTRSITATIINNIIVGDGCGVVADHLSNLVIDYNDVYSFCGQAYPPSGANNVSPDPLFVNAGGGDYHLRASSPVADAGTDVGAPSYDKDGVARPQGDRIDIGAYEGVYVPTLPELYTDGPYLKRADTGEKVILKGFDMASFAISDGSMQTLMYAGFRRLAEDNWGANLIRVVLDEATIRDKLADLDVFIKYADEQGIYVNLIPYHENEPECCGLPDTSIAQLMGELANRYKDKPNILYSVWGEPTPHIYLGYENYDQEWALWLARAKPVAEAIRNNNPRSIVVISGGRFWARDFSYYLAHPFTIFGSRDNILYDLHDYGDITNPDTTPIWPCPDPLPSKTGNLPQTMAMQRCYAKAMMDRNIAPVLIGDFAGVSDYSQDAYGSIEDIQFMMGTLSLINTSGGKGHSAYWSIETVLAPWGCEGVASHCANTHNLLYYDMNGTYYPDTPDEFKSLISQLPLALPTDFKRRTIYLPVINRGITSPGGSP